MYFFIIKIPEPTIADIITIVTKWNGQAKRNYTDPKLLKCCFDTERDAIRAKVDISELLHNIDEEGQSHPDLKALHGGWHFHYDKAGNTLYIWKYPSPGNIPIEIRRS